MTWQHGRGRPRKKAEQIITPELKKKHASGVTRECIDVLKERGIISSQQHWCALHFRWLYTLRYGLPCPTAINIMEHLTDGITIIDDEDKRADLEAEFIAAAKELSVSGALKHVMNAAVYSIFPEPSDIARLSAGLSDLAVLWRRKACF